MPIYIGNEKYKNIYVTDGDNTLCRIKKGYAGSERFYVCGSTVTYKVDSGLSYTEEVDSEASCLAPKTFTPSKSGWTFAGWREDGAADGTVLSSKIMGDSPVTLYAVFRQTITLTLYDGSKSNILKLSGYRYYNNGSIKNPRFTQAQKAYSGWSARGWSTGTAGNAAVTYSSISNTEFSASTTLYGLYTAAVVLTLYNNSTTASKINLTRYFNSYNDTYTNPAYKVSQASRSGWTARGWSVSNAANPSINYSNGATLTLTGSMTLYGCYYQSIRLWFDGNGSTSGKPVYLDSNRYYNSSGNTFNPSFQMKPANQFYRTGFNFVNWKIGSTVYNAGEWVVLSGNATAYAQWKVVPVTYSVFNIAQQRTANNDVYASGDTAGRVVCECPGGIKTNPHGRAFSGIYADVTNFSTVTFTVTEANGIGNNTAANPIQLLLKPNEDIDNHSGAAARVIYGNANGSGAADGVQTYGQTGNLSIDISGISGYRYVGIFCILHNYTSKMVRVRGQITKIVFS